MDGIILKQRELDLLKEGLSLVMLQRATAGIDTEYMMDLSERLGPVELGSDAEYRLTKI